MNSHTMPITDHPNTSTLARKASTVTSTLRLTLTVSSLALACAVVAANAPLFAQTEVTAQGPAETQTAALAQDLPPEPADELGRKVYAIFQEHCARCHQVGALEGRSKPNKGFGNVLDIDNVASDPKYVLAGNAEGSKIVQLIQAGEMPYDVQEGDFTKGVPSEEEIATLKEWIATLGAVTTKACDDRDFLHHGEIVKTISADLQEEQDHRVKNTRYISLANLYNDCETPQEMEIYRQGVVKLLNSLSTNPDVVKLQTVGEDEAIVKFNLDDLNWSTEDWERIAKAYPYALDYDESAYDFVTSQLDTKVPVIRGDWFAFTASRPPLYNALLKLPDTFQELEKKLGVDTLKNIENFLAKRAGFRQSGVSKNNRLIERHTISTGAFWTSYDFAGNSDAQNLYSRPLGPKGENAFVHDGGETIFNLPNGFQAYYLNDAEGAKLDKGPQSIVLDERQKDYAVTNGISCIGCHDNGMRDAIDDIRQHVIDNRNFDKEVRDKVEALYPPQEEIDELLEKDKQRFLNAMRAAGLDPALRDASDLEPVNALSRKYENDLTLRLAAAEYGLSVEEYKDRASDIGGKAKTTLNRLEQSSIPRDTFEEQYPQLVARLTDHQPIFKAGDEAEEAQVAEADKGEKAEEPKVAKVGDVEAAGGAFRLFLSADKSEYQVGEKPVIIVQAEKDCFLTMINVDEKGTATVLMPNRFQSDNKIKANQAVEFPSPDAPFQFRLKDPGTETVVAACNAKSKEVDKITHDFAKRAFTDLGDYEEFKEKTRAIVIEEKVEKAKKAAAKASDEKPAEAKKDVTKEVASLPKRDGVARAAIKITVKAQ